MNRLLIRFALLTLVLTAMQSCDQLYKEDLEHCYRGVSVTLRVDPSMTDAEAAEAAAQDAVIYIFDSEGRFLERRDTHPGQSELFFYPEAGSLTVVGFINQGGGNITSLDGTMVREQGLHTLYQDAEGNHLLPQDIFYGTTSLVNEKTSFVEEHQDILSTRRVGQATITVRMLNEYAGVTDGDFYIVTRSTGNAVDFFGNIAAYNAHHAPTASFNSDSEYVTGNFNLMPTTSGAPMVIEIWHRTEGLIYSTTTHRTGDDIYVQTNQTTNILIDFTTGINVRIEKSQWGVEHSWKTFN